MARSNVPRITTVYEFGGFKEAVVVDVETTGFDADVDRIVSVALVRVNFADVGEDDDGMDVKTMHVIVDPERKIPRAASKVHGITNAGV